MDGMGPFSEGAKLHDGAVARSLRLLQIVGGFDLQLLADCPIGDQIEAAFTGATLLAIWLFITIQLAAVLTQMIAGWAAVLLAPIAAIPATIIVATDVKNLRSIRIHRGKVALRDNGGLMLRSIGDKSQLYLARLGQAVMTCLLTSILFLAAGPGKGMLDQVRAQQNARQNAATTQEVRRDLDNAITVQAGGVTEKTNLVKFLSAQISEIQNEMTPLLSEKAALQRQLSNENLEITRFSRLTNAEHNGTSDQLADATDPSTFGSVHLSGVAGDDKKWSFYNGQLLTAQNAEKETLGQIGAIEASIGGLATRLTSATTAYADAQSSLESMTVKLNDSMANEPATLSSDVAQRGIPNATGLLSELNALPALFYYDPGAAIFGAGIIAFLLGIELAPLIGSFNSEASDYCIKEARASLRAAMKEGAALATEGLLFKAEHFMILESLRSIKPKGDKDETE